MNDKELDSFLKKKINEIQVPKELDINVYNVINMQKSKRNKIKKKSNIYLKFAVCLILIVVISISLITINKTSSTNDDINNNQINNSYAIIDVNSNENLNTSLYLYAFDVDDIKSIFKKLNYNVVIAKVNNINYINYDLVYHNDNNGYYSKEEYVAVRTLADVEVIKSIKGDLNVGDSITVKAKGGILEYSEYMKYWNNTNIENPNLATITSQYNQYVRDGKSKVYISEFGKDDIKLEEGKMYLMFIMKRIWGEYWTESTGNLLREYDENTEMLLNNTTKEYEKLETVLY